MLLLQLTALAVSFRTCFRKVIIPAMGQKRETLKTHKLQVMAIQKIKKTKNKKKNRTNISKKQY